MDEVTGALPGAPVLPFNPGRARTVAPLAGLEALLRQERFPDLMLLPDREPLLAVQSALEPPKSNPRQRRNPRPAFLNFRGLHPVGIMLR